ncbi:unnamed protein product [Prorocentrum cordatum]|uniref:Uncharacterized protein n=1 Tax=Prorocentrum cordatum TaxID=2364126 RepID=A0ABN9X7U3_9DINO|nr:unnamed protein product [Polarella glacialis]
MPPKRLQHADAYGVIPYPPYVLDIADSQLRRKCKRLFRTLFVSRLKGRWLIQRVRRLRKSLKSLQNAVSTALLVDQTKWNGKADHCDRMIRASTATSTPTPHAPSTL